MLTGVAASVPGYPLQERDRRQQRPLFLLAQLGCDRRGEPVLAAAPPFEPAAVQD